MKTYIDKYKKPKKTSIIASTKFSVFRRNKHQQEIYLEGNISFMKFSIFENAEPDA